MGIVRSFHQKNGQKILDSNLSNINFILALPLHKKVNRNNQKLKMLVVPALYPSKI